MSEQPIVSNAADEGQVTAASKKEKLGRNRELDDLKRILSTDFGRRFVWRLLVRAGAFKSAWAPSALIHFNCGQQDFGHYIIAEVEEADQEAFFQMMREAKADRDDVPNKKEK